VVLGGKSASVAVGEAGEDGVADITDGGAETAVAVN